MAGVLVPFLVIATTALQPAGVVATGISWPSNPHWSNFRAAWSVAGFSVLMRASGIVSVSVVPVGVILATLAGFAFGTMTASSGTSAPTGTRISVITAPALQRSWQGPPSGSCPGLLGRDDARYEPE